MADQDHDPVNHPSHYTSVPGIECIQVAEHFGFCLGNVIKYVWRAGEKGDRLEDLLKARFYLNREIEREELRRAEGQSDTKIAELEALVAALREEQGEYYERNHELRARIEERRRA